MQRKYNKTTVPIARNLRNHLTKEERRLWYDFLRTYPIRFSRQKVLGRYVADFYCSQANLVLEIDGLQHETEEGIKNDRIRTGFLEEHGLTVVRIPNRAVHNNFKGVCAYIDQLVKESVEKHRDTDESKGSLG